MKKTVALLPLILLLAVILFWQLAELRTPGKNLSSGPSRSEKTVAPEPVPKAPQGKKSRKHLTHNTNKPSEEPSKDKVDVFGVVRNEAGKPIHGAEVKALHGSKYEGSAGFSVLTTADGWYSLNGLSSSSGIPYRIVASSQGYAPASSGYFFISHEPMRIDLNLTKGASLSGHIMDESRRAIPGAMVKLLQRNWDSLMYKTEIRTEDDGAFSFKNLSPDDYVLVVSANGYIIQRRNVTIASNEIPRAQDFFLEYAGKGYISGITLDENDQPLEGVAVGASQTGVGALLTGTIHQVCTSSADGSFYLEGFVPRGSDGSQVPISVNASKDGYKGAETTVYAGDKRVLIRLQKALSGSISGRVVEGDSSKPITEFQVEILWGNSIYASRRFQSPDGEFLFPDIGESIYDLLVSAPGRAPHFQEFLVVKSGEETSAGVIRLAMGATITGQVKGKEKQEPLPGAMVYIRPGRWTGQNLRILTGASTDETGSYRLEGVPPGPNHVFASYPGYATGSSPKIEVVEGEEYSSVDLFLGKGGSIEGKVTDNGVPLAGQTIMILPVEYSKLLGRRTGTLGPYITLHADEQGYYHKDELMPGFYRCSVYVPRKRASVSGEANLVADTVEILEDETTTLDFDLCGGGSVRGKLLSEIPIPPKVSAIQVWLDRTKPGETSRDGENHYIVETSAGFFYSFDDVCPGVYTIETHFIYNFTGGSRSESTPCRVDPPGMVVVQQGKIIQRDVTLISK